MNTAKSFYYYIVPSAPQSIKAIPASSTKIIVSWLPPLYPNGEIVSNENVDEKCKSNSFILFIIQTAYTFYMSVADGGREEGVHKKVLSAQTDVYETQRLQVILYAM